MARYEFKLPDIGEGIAEAEIVAWHVKVGDTIGEDQQIADMMTDKATVEMESPGRRQGHRAGGRSRRPDSDRVGAGGDRDRRRRPRRRSRPTDSEDERPLADGAVEATPEMAQEIPVTASAPSASASGERAAPKVGLSSPPRSRKQTLLDRSGERRRRARPRLAAVRPERAISASTLRR